MYTIGKEEQIKELTNRVPPILNIDLVIFQKNKNDDYEEAKILIGKRKIQTGDNEEVEWLFPWGRMQFDESAEDTIKRILAKEVPWTKTKIKKLITTISDKGYDHRAYGITLLYLLEYESWTVEPNNEFIEFRRVTKDEMKNIPKVYPLLLSILNDIDSTIASMNSTQDEILLQVDKDNKEIGSVLKRTAHSDPSVYHRAAHIMIFNTKGQVGLQQRAPTKATGANQRDMPGWHQTFWQSMEETAHAELLEEMGIETELTLQRIGLKQTSLQSEYYYLYYGINDGPYAFDKYEVQKVMAFDCQKLLDGYYDKEYSILPHVHDYVRELAFLRKK
jgi:isopentenyldiphosphate isomerase/ADP-ribose pyrophosphatase YjhB (NUDIX family)